MLRVINVQSGVSMHERYACGSLLHAWNIACRQLFRSHCLLSDHRIERRLKMPLIFALLPVIADIIDAHCRGTKARETFVAACIRGHWNEAEAMVEGMLAEPWHLSGYQENRLHEFLQLLHARRGRGDQVAYRPG
jgi:hypothetical protein